MHKVQSIVERLKRIPWLAEALAAIGGLVFLAQAWNFAHHVPSVIDEGMYLYKGYLFASGRYQPFQDYGPWTDHMPLAFLIPGFVQLVFGPGLRTGRFYALGLIVLFVVGLWLVARRLGRRWWAAAAVWVLAVNPAVARIYSLAVSQVLGAVLLVWALVFGLGKNRPRWQLLLGTALAAATFLARINLLPVLVFLVVYIFWQYGRRGGMYAAITGGGIVLVVHALYWPEILKLWAEIIPASVLPFLEPFEMPAAQRISESEFSAVGRVVSLFSGVRFHFIGVMGLLLAGLAWPRLKQEKTECFPEFVFLFALLVALILAHGGVTLAGDYCVFCFANYLSFFSFLGVLLTILATPFWFTRLTLWRRIVVILLILGLTAGIFFGAKGEIVPRFLAQPAVQQRLNALPFVRQNPLLWSAVALGVFGLSSAVLLFGLAYGIERLLSERWPALRRRFGALVLSIFLLSGLLLSPTLLFAGGYESDNCPGDVIGAHEAAGARLAGLIPQGALVYYRIDSPVPLLYIPNVQVFPAQLSGAYSMRIGGDPAELAAYGYWNDALGEQWAAQADYILVDNRLSDHLNTLPNLDDFTLVGETPPFEACRENSRILVYQRNP